MKKIVICGPSKAINRISALVQLIPDVTVEKESIQPVVDHVVKLEPDAPLNIPDNIQGLHRDKIGLQTATKNTLWRAGLETVQDIIVAGPDKIVGMRTFGPSHLWDIDRTFVLLGIPPLSEIWRNFFPSEWRAGVKLGEYASKFGYAEYEKWKEKNHPHGL